MLRVLIVDDAVFMRTSIKLMLEKNGFEIVGEAENGKKAIEKYKEYKPDLVTMDIVMPEMTGVEAVKEIIEYDQDAKIIMMSSMGQESFVKESIINGAKTFVVKPFKEEHVVQTLNQIGSM